MPAGLEGSPIIGSVVQFGIHPATATAVAGQAVVGHTVADKKGADSGTYGSVAGNGDNTFKQNSHFATYYIFACFEMSLLNQDLIRIT